MKKYLLVLIVGIIFIGCKHAKTPEEIAATNKAIQDSIDWVSKHNPSPNENTASDMKTCPACNGKGERMDKDKGYGVFGNSPEKKNDKV